MPECPADHGISRDIPFCFERGVCRVKRRVVCCSTRPTICELRVNPYAVAISFNTGIVVFIAIIPLILVPY